MKKIQQIDCIELLKSLPNNSVDLIFTDPPYNLSTQWVIDEYGKPNPKTKAIDFMGKWDGLNGKILEEWFNEANRVLKYGGRVLMFGMDRQIWVNCYYANFSGLVQQQSLYWYFASSFPKASDLSKNLDKHFGEEREVVGNDPDGKRRNKKTSMLNPEYGFNNNNSMLGEVPLTKPSSPLAQKYDGFKYSIAPLKQTQEVVSVFQKIPDIYWDNRILLAQNIKDILECIMTTTHINDSENGMIASNVEINFISLQAEQLQTQRGNHIAQMSAEEIEKIFACTVEMASMLRQAKLENIAVQTVMENLCADLKAQTIHSGLADDLRELMGMYLSEIPKTQSNGYLNIGQLWLNILVEIWIETKMFTTSTKSEMITELKILNYYLTENIKHFMQQETLPNENSQKLIASSVIRNFTNVILKLQKLNEIFVQNHAGIVSCEMKQSPQNETIMVFQKPYKTGSAMHDTLAFENGDEECCCGALNIDDNRIPSNGNELNARKNKGGSHGIWDNSKIETGEWNGNDGRFPAQCFVDSETAKLLDEQSGIRKSDDIKLHHNRGKDGHKHHNVGYGKFGNKPLETDVLGSIGGCSKILHKCDYDEKDIELYYYCPKVDKKERNMGMDDFTEEKTVGHNRFDKCKTCNGYILQNQDRKSACKCENPVREDNKMSGNYHPTVKPLNLLLKILNLFKTPNPQVCVDTFAGSGSIPIAAELLGFEVIAGDLDEGFVEISNARLDYAIKNKTSLLKKYKQPEPIKPTSTNQSFF